MIINRIIKWFLALPDLLKFLGLVSVTLVVTYYAPSPVRAVWYAILLVSYYFSKNEALWLALFLATADGFIGFFGMYAATLTVFPGLPAIEIVQIYIILSVVKAAGSKERPAIFYTKYLQLLFIYLLFSIVWGQLMGLSGGLNVYFRVLKVFLPMLLFYSIPRLFTSQDSYYRFFRIIFIIVLAAFAAQIFTLLAGVTPMEAGGVSPPEDPEGGGRDFRVFYNSSSTLLGLFGALYYLGWGKDRFVRKKGPGKNSILLLSTVFAALAMALLSATRGWILSFSFIVLLTFALTGIIKTRRNFRLVIIAIPLIIWAASDPIVNRQITFAIERLGSLEAISEGDLSAEGTLQRLDYRNERVMGGWKENPVFGWGLSDKGYEYEDGHVGNQSLLATAGIVGYAILNGFLIYFAYMMLDVYFRLPPRVIDRKSLLVFIIFLAGWFAIHSTSGQQFNFTGMPVKIMPQALFFSFGAFEYKRALSMIYGKKI